MPTKREMGYRIFRANGSAASSGASKVGGTTDTSSTVRYGTAVADSSNGMVQVKLDNSDSIVNCTCDTLIYKGDRVTVIVTSTGLMKAIPIGQNLVDYTDQKADDLAQDIIDQGNQIREDVADDIAEIDAKVDAAQAAADAAKGKADAVGEQANSIQNQADQIQADLTETANDLSEQLTVVDQQIDGLNSTITGVASDATSALTQVAQVRSDVDGLEVTVTQQAETLNGTIQRVSKTETDVNGLTNTVSSVSKKLDTTVTSVSSLSNTVDGLESTVSKVSETVDGTVTSISTLTNTVNGLSSTVTQTTTTAKEALSKASTLENTVDGMQSTVSQAYENAEEALTQTSSLSNTVDGLSSNVTTAYENAQEALTQSSEAKQTADSVQTTLSTNYYTKGQTDQTFASQTQLSQTSTNILNQVSSTYQVKGDYVTSADMSSAIDQSASQIESSVTETVMNEVGDTYATKTELTQTSDSLTLKINSSIASGYATCTTASSTAAKVATTQASGFTRATGVQVAVKFTYANSASNPTLNINGTGAAAIRLKNAALAVDDSWEAGDTVVFVFDGTYWQVADPSLQIAKTVSSYFKADATGLEVGREGDPISTKMTSSGAFQILDNGSAAAYYDENGWHAGSMVLYDSLITAPNMNIGFGSFGTTGTSWQRVPVENLTMRCKHMGAITKACSTTRSLTSSDNVVPIGYTVASFNPVGSMSTGTNYIRVLEPDTGAYTATTYVKVSAHATAGNMSSGKNFAFSIIAGPSSTWNSSSNDTIAVAINSSGNIMTECSIGPFIYSFTGSCYFFLVARSTGGGGTLDSYTSQSYAPMLTVEIIGFNY